MGWVEGYVEVFADVVSLAHDAKEVVGEVGGVGVVEVLYDQETVHACSESILGVHF